MLNIKKRWVFLPTFALLIAGYLLIPSIQYWHLEELLKARDWQQADRETTNIILTESNWKFSVLKMWAIALTTGKLQANYEPIRQYPCSDLQRLNSLWLKYSEGNFGLSVQQQIYEKAVVQSEDEFKAYDYFSRETGQNRSDFSIDVPRGHFPSDRWVRSTSYSMGEPWFLSATHLYDRLKECQISHQ